MEQSEPPPEEKRLELYVQSLAPHGARPQQESAIQRLVRLEETGFADELSLDVWGKRLCATSEAVRTEAGHRYVERLEQFRDWEGSDGRSAAPCLHTHPLKGDLVDGEYTVVNVPVMLLAEFDGDRLVHVAPCKQGDSTTTVTERIAALERAADVLDEVDSDRADRGSAAASSL